MLAHRHAKRKRGIERCENMRASRRQKVENLAKQDLPLLPQGIDIKWIERYAKSSDAEKASFAESLRFDSQEEVKKLSSRFAKQKKQIANAAKDLSERALSVHLNKKLQIDTTKMSLSDLLKLGELEPELAPRIATALDNSRKYGATAHGIIDTLCDKYKIKRNEPHFLPDEAWQELKATMDTASQMMGRGSIQLEDINDHSNSVARKMLLVRLQEINPRIVELPKTRRQEVTKRHSMTRSKYLEGLFKRMGHEDPLVPIFEFVSTQGLKEQLSNMLNQQYQSKKYTSDDMIGIMAEFPKISLSTFDLMHRLAGNVFPSISEVKKRLKERYGHIEIGRILQPGSTTLLARTFALEEALKLRFSAYETKLKVTEGELLADVVLGGDSFSMPDESFSFGQEKRNNGRFHAALNFVNVRYIVPGKQTQSYHPGKVNSRRAATPLIVARSKDNIVLLRRLTTGWNDSIRKWSEGTDGTGQTRRRVRWWLAGDEPFKRVMFGLTTTSSMWLSVHNQMDEAFAKILQRSLDKVDRDRTLAAMNLQGTIADYIQGSGLTLSSLSSTIQEAEQLEKSDQLVLLTQFRDSIKPTYEKTPSKVLLKLKERAAPNGNATGPSGLEKIRDSNVNLDSTADGIDASDPSNIALANMEGDIKVQCPTAVEWLIGWLAGQKTRPIIQIEPKNSAPGLLHLDSNVTIFLRDLAATVAREAGKFDEFEVMFTDANPRNCLGPMQGNDVRSFWVNSLFWANFFKDIGRGENLLTVLQIYEEIRPLLRDDELSRAERIKLVDLILQFAVELDTWFPEVLWRHYVVALVRVVPDFLHLDIGLPYLSEDWIEHLIQFYKRDLGNKGGGKPGKDGQYKNDVEYQQITKQIRNSDPNAETVAGKTALVKRKQCCGACEQTGHNSRTCENRRVRKISLKRTFLSI